MEEDVFCYDLETKTANPDSPNPELDEMRYIGIKTPKGKNLMYYHTQKDKIHAMWDKAKYVVGHNIKKRIYNQFQMGYDNPIMKRYGYSLKDKIFIDTQEILETRAKSMMYEDLKSFSLRNSAIHFKLPCQKGDFDFHKLQKDYLTPEEVKEMRTYLEGDLDTTHALFQYLYDMFKVLKKYVSKENRENMTWLTCSSGSLGYKIFCEQSGRPETYSKHPIKTPFDGAIMYVHPTRRFFKNLVVNDFASLYPNIKAGFHLSQRVVNNKLRFEGTPVKKENQWTAKGTIYEGFIKGTYSRIAGNYEKSIISRFFERQEVKKIMRAFSKGTKEYMEKWFEQNGIKIGMNSEYGAGGNAVFESMYDIIASGDTTGGARACITHAKDYYESYGYVVAYQHTDSLYIEDPFNDLTQVKAMAKDISQIQKDDMLFDYKTHDFTFEDQLDYLWLVRDEKGNKKNRNIRKYKDGGIGYTGIRLANVQCSLLAHKVFEDYIVPHLMKGREDCEFPLQWIYDKIKEVGLANPQMLEKEWKTKKLTSYKSTSSIQAQISFRYGMGRHHLIPNKFIGAGKSKHYATQEELEMKFGNDWINTVMFNAYISDLKEFVKVGERKLISKL